VWQPVAALTAIVVFGGALANFTGFSMRDFGRKTTPGPAIKVYLAACEPGSDFELSRGGRTLLFVCIPHLTTPVNRLVFGTAVVRAVNTGSASITNTQLTTIFSEPLWNPALGTLDKDSVTSLSGEQKLDFRYERVDDRWVATRTLPRLDPMTGAPCPVSFLLQTHGATPEGEVNKAAEGEIDVRMFGPDWVGLKHIVEIRCIAADSAEEFIASGQRLASALRSGGHSDVAVVFAFTGGHGVVPVKGGPTIIQAKITSFIELKQRMLHEF
jgi:hypothetical protein